MKNILCNILNRKQKQSEIISTKIELNGLDLYGNTALRSENIVKFNNNTYLFVTRCSGIGIIIDIRNEKGDIRFKRTQLTASFLNDASNWYIKLLSINKLDIELQKKNGFGYLMMKFMLDIALEYEKTNNIHFTKLVGIIGTEGQDNPEQSIPLYRKFNHYLYDAKTNRYLFLDEKHCNATDKMLNYSIQKK